MPFRNMSGDDVRNLVRHQIETLERWLRRLVDDQLRKQYGGVLETLPIKADVKARVAQRRASEPQRYPREVDALLFDDLTTIICHPQLYRSHFQDALKEAFPQGGEEARTFLTRIVDARNPVSHANEITLHQAMRVICYSTDVIDSLKSHYVRNNLAQLYNAPSFLRVWDCFGNTGQIDKTEGCVFRFTDAQLRPGDMLQLEVQPDESFPEGTYTIRWGVCNVPRGEHGTGRSFSLTLKDHHVSQNGLSLQVQIISDRSWHRHYGQYDAMFYVFYSVLPPI